MRSATAAEWIWLGCFAAGVAIVLATSGGTFDAVLGLLGLVMLGGNCGAGLVAKWWRAAWIAPAAAVICRQAGLGLDSWWRVTAVLLGVLAVMSAPSSQSEDDPASDFVWFEGGTVAGALLTWITLPLWFPFQTVGPVGTSWILRVHPVMAMNAAVSSLGVWTEQPIPYRWTRLGQDIPYALPGGVGWTVLFHLIVATILWLAAGRRRSSMNGGDRRWQSFRSEST